MTSQKLLLELSAPVYEAQAGLLPQRPSVYDPGNFVLLEEAKAPSHPLEALHLLLELL